MMKKLRKKELFSLIIILSLVLSSCAAGNTPGTSREAEPETSASAKSEPETAAPETSEPEPTAPAAETPYDLDRNQVDLSRYHLEDETEIEGIPLEPPLYMQLISDPLFEKEAEAGEVKLYQLDVDPLYRKESRKISVHFEELPAYEEAKEQAYFFNGSRISFVLPDFDTGTGYESLYGRAVAREEDHAFVLKHIVQAAFLPYAQEKNEPVVPRLFVCIENENGITDTFIIREDLRVLHAASPYGEDGLEAEITDISVDPVSPYAFLKLSAMAVRHLHTEREESRDIFGIWRAFPSASKTFEETAAEAFSQLEIRISYGEKERVLDDQQAFTDFVRIFCDGIETRYTAAVFETVLSDETFRENGLKVSVTARGDGAKQLPYYPAEFWVTTDGRVWQTPEALSVCTGGGLEQLYQFFRAGFVTHTVDSFPFDEIVSYLSDELPPGESSEAAYSLAGGRYELQSEAEVIMAPYLLIQPGGFVIVQEIAVSYQPTGTLEIIGSDVVMEANYKDEVYRWVFELTGDNVLTFRAGKSKVPAGGAEWKDGMTFALADD